MNAKNLMNLTQHNVDIHGDEGFIVTFPPSGTVARCAEVRESCPPVAIGLTVLDVSRATYGEVIGWESAAMRERAAVEGHHA